jgi:hypothetical protein
MKCKVTRNVVLSALAVFAILLAAAVPASAQATRTWVSGVGDDANPCSRTAPCKTFAGAISKTAVGGEINVLDPGGFGAVTITKSITISSQDFEAGVLVSGTNGIVISAGPADNVILRGLDIEGLGTGLTGIKILSAGDVHVENCTIHNFTQWGIQFVPSSPNPTSTSTLHVSNTIIRDNLGASSGGILVKPSTNVTSALGDIENVQLRNNFAGLRVEDFGTVQAKNTTAANNSAGSGFIAHSVGGAGSPAVLTLNNCVSMANATGVKSDQSAGSFVRVAGSMIFANTNGFVANSGATLLTWGNNFNTDPNSAAPTGPAIGQQ